MIERAAVDVADDYRRMLTASGAGTLTELDLSVYDRTGVPVVATVWDAANGVDAHGVGYGATEAAASVGALGELAERVLMNAAADALPTVRDTYRELHRRLGPDGVADPVTLVLDAGADYDPERPLEWVPAMRWRTGDEVLVPREFGLSAPSERSDGLITPVTNGLGAGDTLERAVAHGLLELIQRDGDNVRFRALDRGIVIDLDDGADPDVLAVRQQLRDAGIEPVLKLASTELACVVYCLGRDDDPSTTVPALAAIGEAAHPDRSVAAVKAMLEFASSRARRVFAFGPLDAVARHHPDYLRAELNRPLGTQEPRALAAMRQWRSWSAGQARRALRPLFAHERTVAYSSLPASPARQPADVLAVLLERVGDVLIVAGGAPGGMRAAKVICPGLEVETMSYLRVGARAAKDLLAGGPPGLVGHGRPTTADQLPIHLTPDAEDELGGPLWIDRGAVARAVGDLYPLYREPRRHAVERLAAS